MKKYCVSIKTNRYNTPLYMGVTNDLYRCVMQHKAKEGGKITSKNRLSKLVYNEISNYASITILRDNQIIAGSRKNKEDLIKSINPDGRDLFDAI